MPRDERGVEPAPLRKLREEEESRGLRPRQVVDVAEEVASLVIAPEVADDVAGSARGSLQRTSRRSYGRITSSPRARMPFPRATARQVHASQSIASPPESLQETGQEQYPAPRQASQTGRRAVAPLANLAFREQFRLTDEPGAVPEPARASTDVLRHHRQPPEAAELVRDLKLRHAKTWLDQPIPALEGRTPRVAIRTAAGRARVDSLLKEWENREQRQSPAERIDVSLIRRELGL